MVVKKLLSLGGPTFEKKILIEDGFWQAQTVVHRGLSVLLFHKEAKELFDPFTQRALLKQQS